MPKMQRPTPAVLKTKLENPAFLLLFSRLSNIIKYRLDKTNLYFPLELVIQTFQEKKVQIERVSIRSTDSR